MFASQSATVDVENVFSTRFVKDLEVFQKFLYFPWMGMTPKKNFDHLFVFVDESGNFDFSSSGTQFFVMASFMTTDPFSSASGLSRLKYDLISRGQDVSDFRASRDMRWIRDEVFKSILGAKRTRSHVVFSKKFDVVRNLGTSAEMYREFALEIGHQVLLVADEMKVDGVSIIFDQTIAGSQRESLRNSLMSLFEYRERHLRVFFHPLSTDFNGQLADYIAWAKFRDLERGDREPWKLILESLSPTTQDLFG